MDSRATIVVVNATRVDFDDALDWTPLERLGDAHRYDDCDCDATTIATRCEDHGAVVLVTKPHR